MAALYVTDVTRSVLTGSTLLFFGVLLCVGYGLSVRDPVLRECIAMLSEIASLRRLKWYLAPHLSSTYPKELIYQSIIC